MNRPNHRTFFSGRGQLVRRVVCAFQIFLNVLFLVAPSLGLPNPVQAAENIDQRISYQAHLNDGSGTPVADGTYSIKFSIYNAATGGTRLWTAAGTVSSPTAISVSVVQGLFSVLLGDTGQNSLNTIDWNQSPLYLGVTVSSDSEMTPRRALASVGQAFNSQQLQGQSASGTTYGTSSLFTINQTSNTGATGTRSALQVQSSGTSTSNDLLIRGINDLGTDVFTLNRAGSVTTTGGINVLGSVTSTFSGSVSTTFATISQNLLVAGQAVCLASGTNCPGVAASTSTLQQTTNNGASTTNELYLFGGFIGSSSTVTSTLTVLGATALGTLTATNATFTNATATTLGASVVSTTQLYVAGQQVCLQNGASCPAEADTLATVSARGSFATTTLQLYGGFLASSSTVTSTFTVLGNTSLQNLTAANATFTQVTSTNIFANVVSTTQLFVNSQTVCLTNGTNCPGSAATTATLQQISNNGATTTNELYLQGGLITNTSTVTGTLTVLGTSALQTLTATNATFTQVTSTNLAATVVTTSQLYVASQLVCLQSGTNCPAEADTLATVSARGSFTPTTLQLYGGFIGASSTVTSTFTVVGGTTLGTLTFTNATGNNVTTTNEFTSNLTATNGTITTLTGTNATFQAVTSTVWLGFATASGTTLNASAVLVNGINTCLQNGTNCPGSAATTATLQQISNNGATTTNELYLQGGFIGASSTVTSTFTVLGTTSLQGLTFTIATGTSVTTTNLFGTNGTFTNLSFTNGTSTSWLGFATASGTTLNAGAVLVNGFNVCLANGTNCPTGTTPNLQTVTNAGNTTTNAIQFAGGTSTATFIELGGNLTSSSTVTGTLTVLGTSALQTLTATNATFTQVTSTNIAATVVTTSQLYVASQLVCLQSGTNCPAEADTLATVSARGSFTPTTLQLYGGFIGASSTVTSTFTVVGGTTLGTLTFTNATGNNVTTTNEFTSNLTATNGTITTLTGTNATFQAVTSTVWLGFATASGTTLNAGAVLVNGINACLANGTNCPGSAATTATLQQISNNGATTTNELYLLGGLIGASSTVTSTFTVLGTSSLQGLTFTIATGTSVTTTNLFGTNGTFTNLTFTNGTSTSWLGFATASGTTLNAGAVLVNGFNVCQSNGVNCPGSAATTATLQQISNNGATTTNELYLLGGLITNTSTVTGTLTVLGASALQTLTATNATFTQVTSTNLAATVVTTSQLYVASQLVCLQSGTNCPADSDTLATVSARGNFATTTLQLLGGFIGASSTVTSTFTVVGGTTLGTLTFTQGTGTSVTTTNEFTSNLTATNGTITTLTGTNATFSAVTSTVWLGFATASGTTLNASAVLVNGINTCLQNGTNCPGSAATTATLQQISNNGATTTNELYLQGGFIGASSTVTSAFTVLGTSSFQGLTFTIATGTSVTTTNLFGTNGTFTNLSFTNGTSTSWLGFATASGTTLNAGAVLVNGFNVCQSNGVNCPGSAATTATLQQISNNGATTTNELYLLGGEISPSTTVTGTLTVLGSTALQGLTGTNATFTNVTTTGLSANFASSTFFSGTPANPTLRSSVSTVGSMNRITYSGRYAYAGETAYAAFDVIDVSNPDAPSTTARVVTSGGNIGNVRVLGHYLFTTIAGAPAFQVYDISSPNMPQLVGSVNVGTNGYMDISGQYAYVGSSNILNIFDISDPLHPKFTGSYSTSSISTVFVHDHYAYLSLDVGGMAIIDVADPKNPVPIGNYVDGTGINSVSVSGRYAYLTNSSGNVYVVDVSVPTSTRRVGSTGFLPSGPFNATLAFPYLYVADAGSGLMILNVANPANPQRVASIDTPGTTSEVALNGRFAYLADGANMYVADLYGLEAPSAEIGSLFSGMLTVGMNADIVNDLEVGDSLLVGQGGILSLGSLSSAATNTTSTFAGAVSTSRLLVNGQQVCLLNGTNCPGSAATTATLQQISNNGATTTNELYLLGGLITNTSTVTGTLTVLGTSALQTLTATNATFTQVTSTNLAATVVTTSQLYVASQLVCLQTGTNCPAEADTLATVSARGSFTPTTLQLYGGFIGASSTVTSTFTVVGGTTLGTLTFTQGTGTSVTTTNEFTSNLTATNGTITTLTGTNATFQAVTSTVWLGFATASGTTLNASAVLVNGINTCLQNGTNCPGSAATTATLQQISNNGATTTNELYLLGGEISPSTTVTSTFTVLGTSSLQGLTFTIATGTSVTTTNLFGTNGTFTNLSFTNGTSTSWLGFATASGTTLNAGAVLVNGFNVCQSNGVNCPGSAATTATLQQISNNGATTTNELYLQGGFIGASSTVTSTFTVLGSTTLQAFTATNATLTQVTTTYLGVTYASATQMYVAGQLVCLQNGTACPGEADTLATVSARGSFSTTTLQFYGGFIGASSTVTSTFTVVGGTTLGTLTFTQGTGTSVTSTNLFSTNAVFTAVTSTVWLGFATASGTTLNASQVLVNGINTCLANGTNCPGIAAATSTLQQVSNNGATTTNELYLQGGLITSSSTVTSSLNVLGALSYTAQTSTSPFTIKVPSSSSTPGFDYGFSFSSTNTNAGLTLFRFNQGTDDFTGLMFANDITNTNTSGALSYFDHTQDNYTISLSGASGINSNAASFELFNTDNTADTSAFATAQIENNATNSSTNVLALRNGSGQRIVQSVGGSSPEGSVYANAGSIYFREHSTAAGTQAYLKTQNNNSTGWKGIATTDQLASGASLQQVTNVGATTSNMLTLLGGFIGASSTVTSSLTVVGNTQLYTSASTTPVAIHVPEVPFGNSFGLTITGTSTNAGIAAFTYNQPNTYSSLAWADDVTDPYHASGTFAEFDHLGDAFFLYVLGGSLIKGANNPAGISLYNLDATQYASQPAPVSISGFSGKPESVLNLISNYASTTLYVSTSSPEGVVTANAGSLYFRSLATTTVLYTKTTDGVNTGWVGLRTDSEGDQNWKYSAVSDLVYNATPTTPVYFGFRGNKFVASAIFNLSDTTFPSDFIFGAGTSADVWVGQPITGASFINSAFSPDGAMSDLYVDGNIGSVSSVYTNGSFVAGSSTYGNGFISKINAGLLNINTASGTAFNNNVVIGGTSTTNTGLNSNFVMDGNDLFVSGNIGSASSVYTNGEFVAGSSSTHYGNGYITKNDTGPLNITSVSGTAFTNGVTQLWTANSNPQILSQISIYKLGPFIIRDKYLYAASNTTMITYDISDPTHIVQRGTLAIGAGINNFQQDSQYLYVMGNDNSVRFIDTSTPTTPVINYSIPLAASGFIRVVGTRLFLFAGGTLRAYNLTKSNATLGGTLSGFASSSTAFDVYGNHAYIGDLSLHVIDVTRTGTMGEVGTLAYGSTLTNFVADGPYVYGADKAGNRLAIFDVSTPASPSLATTVTGYNAPSANFGALTKNGRYVYVVDSSGIEVTDVLSTSTASIVKTYSGVPTVAFFQAVGRYGFVTNGAGLGYIASLDLAGSEFAALAADSLEAGTVRVLGDSELIGQLIVDKSLAVGSGGITSQGPLVVNSTGTASTFQGDVNLNGKTIVADLNATVGSITGLIATNATFTQATSTNFFSTNLWGTNASATSLIAGSISVTGTVSFAETTNTNPVTITVPASTSTSAFVNGLNIYSTNTYSGFNFFRFNAGHDFSGETISDNVFNSNASGTLMYFDHTIDSYNLSLMGTGGVNVSQPSALVLHNTNNASDTNALAAVELENNAANSSSAVLVLNGLGQKIVQYVGSVSPDGSIYGNSGSIYFKTGAPSTTTQAYLKTQSGNSLGWQGIVTTPDALATSTQFSIPNQANGFTVQNDLMAITNTSGAPQLVLINVAASSSPTIMSTTSFVAPSLPILDGRYMFVYEANTGLLNAFDITDQRHPSVLSTSGPGFVNPKSAYIDGSYLYIGDDNGLNVVDISNPAATSSFKTISTLSLSGTSKNGLIVRRGYAYLTTNSLERLYVIDVRNPRNPVLSQTLTGVGGASDIVGNDSFLYVGSTSGSVYTIDNRSVTSVTATLSFTGLSSEKSLAMSGNTLYFGDTTNTYAYDVSSSTAPTLLKTKTNTISTSHLLASDRGRLYSSMGSTVTIYDEGTVNVGALRVGSVDAGDLTVRGAANFINDVHIGGGLDVGFGGIQNLGSTVMNGALTVTNLPPTISSTSTVSSSDSNCPMDADGNTVIRSCFSAGSFIVEDISNPDSPVILSTTTLSGSWTPLVRGRYAYVFAFSAGTLNVYDLINRNSPSLVGTVSGFSSPDGLFIQGSLLYASDGNGLHIVDVSAPANPRRIAFFSASGSRKYGLYVRQGTAYVTGGTVLHIINVKDPSSIAEPNTIGGFNSLGRIDANDSTLYMHDAGAGQIISIDIRNANSPKDVATTTLGVSSGGASGGVAVNGDRLFDSNTTNISMYDISNPRQPNYLTTFGSTVSQSNPDIRFIGGRLISSASAAVNIYDLGGIRAPSLRVGSGYISDLMVERNLSVQNDGFFNGVSVGNGGIYSQGNSYFSSNSNTPTVSIVNQGSGASVSTWGAYINRLSVGSNSAATGTANYSMVLTYASGTTAGGLCIDDTGTANTCPTTGINGASLFADGNVTANAFDLAERYLVSGTSTPGDVLVIDNATSGTVKTSTGIPYDPRAIGIASANPGFRLGWIDSSSSVDVALNGRVPTRISMENGPVHAGDLLTTSHTPGMVMKALHPGVMVGYALEDAVTTGTVEVFVNVGYNANMALNNDGTLAELSDNILVGPTTVSSTLVSGNSWGLTFRGSVWDASTSSTINRDFTLLTDVISATSSAFTIRNASSSDLFAVDASGSVRIAGDLGIMGRLYPSARGHFQDQYYLYVDDTSSTDQYLSTNADGWQAESSYDLAERYHSSDALAPGDVVMASTDGNVGTVKAVSGSPIMGVVSTKPGFLLGMHATDTYPIALTGRVPTRVTASNGAIHAGDELALSDTPGVAQKATQNGYTIGIALEDYSNAETGLIQVLINPQWNGSFSGGSSAPSSGSSGDSGYQGFADIAAGSTTVNVSFSSLGTFANVHVSPYAEVNGGWWIEHVTDAGFRIVMGAAQGHDVRFAWHAVPSKTGDYLYNSDGTFGTIDPTTGIGPAMGPGSTASTTGTGTTSSTGTGTTSSTDTGTGTTSSTNTGTTTTTDTGTTSSTGTGTTSSTTP
jgi:hypothetical protein